MLRWALLLVCAAIAPHHVAAQDLDLHGYLDLRVVAASDARSFIDGGLGKTRFGDGDTRFQFGGAALQGTWQATPEVLALASVQFQTTDQSTVDVVEAYLRYRPVSTTAWRWSVRVGEFFPPVSLENDGVGWTSRYTLTPSAINTWIGEEFRAFGAEVRLEHRAPTCTIEGAVALFGANDPAGELLAARGWALSDLNYGFGSSVREPDYQDSNGVTVTSRYDPYVEIDHRLGWYGEVDLRSPRYGRFTLLRYDNRADPTTYTNYSPSHEVFSWHTKFWSAGWQTRIGDVVLLGQAIEGDTEIAPSPFFSTYTRFHAGYLLAAWDRGSVRPAVRVDMFQLRQLPEGLDGPSNEHGNAITFALNWRPREWLRVTGEVLRIDSSRTQRAQIGLDPRSVDTQVQLSARLLF